MSYEVSKYLTAASYWAAGMCLRHGWYEHQRGFAGCDRCEEERQESAPLPAAPLPADAPAYVDERSRDDYLRQKRAARQRMRDFDQMPATLRNVVNAAGATRTALHLWQAGVATFEEAERRVAGE